MKYDKYGEDIIIHKIREFIKKSYDGHYTTTKEGFQAIDIFRELDIDKDFCQANAIKYLLRFGKKNGRNEEDLYKAIHYVILLLSSSFFWGLLPGELRIRLVLINRLKMGTLRLKFRQLLSTGSGSLSIPSRGLQR